MFENETANPQSDPFRESLDETLGRPETRDEARARRTREVSERPREPEPPSQPNPDPTPAPGSPSAILNTPETPHPNPPRDPPEPVTETPAAETAPEHNCNGGWTCEAHTGQPWQHDEENCDAPGMPCGVEEHLTTPTPDPE
jgi:hypothetical protein